MGLASPTSPRWAPERASTAAPVCYGESALSNTASATTTATQIATTPTAPSHLSATALSTTQVSLGWSDNSSNETGFRIERSTNGKRWSQVATVGAGVTSYSESGLKRNTTYYYRVRAYNSAGNSAYSNIASTKTSASGPTRIHSNSSTLFSTTKIGTATDLDDDLAAMGSV